MLEQRLGPAEAWRMLERSYFWMKTELEIEVRDAFLLVVLVVVKHSKGIHRFVCPQLSWKMQV